MKNKAVKTGILIILAASAMLLTGQMLAADIAPPAGETYEQTAVTIGGTYIVKSHNGIIAVYTDGFTVLPAIETDITVDSLRAYDKQLLENGLTVNSYEEVLRLLEDFGS